MKSETTIKNLFTQNNASLNKSTKCIVKNDGFNNIEHLMWKKNVKKEEFYYLDQDTHTGGYHVPNVWPKVYRTEVYTSISHE